MRYFNAPLNIQQLLHQLILKLHLFLHIGYIYTFDVGSQSKKISACVHSQSIDIRLPRNRSLLIWSFRAGQPGGIFDKLSHENLKQSWVLDIQSSKSKRIRLGNAKYVHSRFTFYQYFNEAVLTPDQQKEIDKAMLFAIMILTEITAQMDIEFEMYHSRCPINLDDY